jgi:hypothetical protein
MEAFAPTSLPAGLGSPQDIAVEARPVHYITIENVTPRATGDMHGEEEPKQRSRGRNIIRLCRHFGNRLRSQELRQGARQGHGGGRSHIGGTEGEPGDEKTRSSEAKDEGREEGRQEEADGKKDGSQKETSLIPSKALTSFPFRFFQFQSMKPWPVG